MALDAAEFNGLFFGAMKQGDAGIEKLSASLGTYIQEKIRESGFARRILDTQTVTPQECQISPEHNGLEFLVPLEPQTVAQRVTFRGEPDHTWIEKKIFPIRFETIMTDEFNKTEEELMAHREPVLKIIEQNSVKDIQEQEDVSFLTQVKAAAFASTYRLNRVAVGAGGVVGFTTGAQVDAFFKSGATPANPENSNIVLSANTYFRRDVLTELSQILTMRQLELKVFLLHKYNFDETLRWFADEIGHQVANSITIDGYKESTVGGFTFITTIKTNRELVRAGHIYGFADKAALGKFLILTGTKFWINKRRNVITMAGWETIGAGIGNINGCAILLLAGSVPLDVNVPSDVNAAVGAPTTIRIYPIGVARAGGALPHQ